MSGDETITQKTLGDGATATSDKGTSSIKTSRDWSRIALEEIIRPLAISAMLTCIVISLNQLIGSVASEWPGGILSVLTLLVCLESIHAKQLLTRLELDSRERWRFRFVEWVFILLVVRFGVYIKYGAAQLAADVARWSMDVGAFFDIGFIANGMLMAIFWSLALALSSAMQELEASPTEKRPRVTDPHHYLYSTMPRHGRIDRYARLKRITGIFTAGGMVLLILAGLARVDVRNLMAFDHSYSSGVLLNVLAYFLIGFLLIGQARYTILRAHWEIEGIPVMEGIGKRWVLLALAFLFLIGLVSAVLPVGYSVGMVDTLSTVLQWTLYVLTQIAFGLLFLISSLLALLIGFMTGTPTETQPSAAPVARPQAPPAVSGRPMPWWPLVRSLAFWTVLIGIIGYSIFHFADYRWSLLKKLSLSGFFRWLLGLWQGIRSGTQKATAEIRRAIANRLPSRESRTRRRPWRYISLRGLPLRERIRYFYLSTLRRSAKQNLGRPPSATPWEYQSILAKEIPEIAEQFDELTQAFIEARYSEHPITEEKASRVKNAWRGARKTLGLYRRRKRNEPTQTEEENT
ncbi:MAG: DUF4129 domain-containing protein [Chloroflexota bacterium]|nr:DUF4129 domain-containing protein [Chloroflexota bacterium]